MRRWLKMTARYAMWSCQGLAIVLGTTAAHADESRLDLLLRWGLIGEEHGRFVVRGQAETLQPVQPLDTLTPVQPLDTLSPVQPLDTGLGGMPVGSSFAQVTELFQEALEMSSTTGVESVNANQARVLGATDAGAILQESSEVQTVSVQRRSPVALDPYIRGYRSDQILVHADGALWPARRDLDSMISKIDPSLISEVVVHSGPYGLRYGPGFAFINAVTADTPRYCNGYESHTRTGFTFRHNGSQIYGREMVYGGNADWGYIVAYGIRDGADYRPGEDAPFSHIPSSYHSQNFHAQFGFDVTEDTNVEIRYQRVDETDTEFAAQFFDVNFLGTDAVSVTVVQDDPCCDISTRVNAWYNFTRFTGDTDTSVAAFDRDPGVLRKRGAFPVVDRVERALDDLVGFTTPTSSLYGFTWGDFTSAGVRASRTYGPLDDRHLRVGADVRYLEQRIDEQYHLLNANTGQRDPAFGNTQNPFNTNLPRSEMVDPGLFAEYSVPWLPYVTTAVGGRVDFARTAQQVGPEEEQNDMLYAFYLSNELQVSSCVVGTLGVGYAERAPSLVDRYSNSIFLGFIQSGFNRVIGDPQLRKERVWQVDLGIEADYGWWSLGGGVFHSWIDDYNLYQGELVNDPSGARLLRATNAELVTLYGAEFGGDMDLTDRISSFASIRYLEGRDKNIQVVGQPGTIDQSLYGIVPLEGRFGFRLVDECDGEFWGIELGTRMVDDQNQVAWLRQGSGTITGLVPLEEATPGFTTYYVRAYWNATPNLNIVGGIENLLDRAYYEHLDLRLLAQQAPPGDPRSVDTRVYAPGITPYFGVEYTY